MDLACADYNRRRAAKLAAMSLRTFQRQLRTYRIRVPVVRRKLNRNDIVLIRELLRALVPRREVARKFEVSHTTIIRIESRLIHRTVR